MRLIDADKLDEEIMYFFMAITGNPKQSTVINECKSSFRRIIDEQPTAYDVDKVVKQLEAKKEDCERLVMDETHDVLDKIQTETAEAFAMAYEEAIDIVKAGVEE